jgi:Icc-related predicted phosphoesterase
MPEFRAAAAGSATGARGGTVFARREGVRIAAVADLHVGRHTPEFYSPLFEQANEADVLVICGDLTDHGRVDEAQQAARLLAQNVRVPIVGVLGNHDFESSQAAAVQKVLCDNGVQILDGDAIEIKGIGFAGVKGFCGGFDNRALGPWGEPTIKAFVQETVAEALKLEAALARLRAVTRIALLHYAPIAATVQGEPLEIFPFLGSSRLEEPLARYRVAAVFHGHAHHGCAEGQTSKGDPVYNVSLPLLQASPGGHSARIVTVDTTAPAR